jgi:hypothetical protein
MLRHRPVSQQTGANSLPYDDVVAKSGCAFFWNGNTNPQRAPGVELPLILRSGRAQALSNARVRYRWRERRPPSQGGNGGTPRSGAEAVPTLAALGRSGATDAPSP